MRARAIYVLFALLTILAGLTIRFAHLGLPWPVMKYGGSALWAAMIYWSLAITRPRTTPLTLAIVAGIIATLVEFLKLYHSPALDAFRLTLPGVLLLGRFFSVWDIVAYWLAIAAGALLDRLAIRH